MSNKSDITRNQWMLTGPLSTKGYDWWWHSFTAYNKQTGESKPVYIEFFTCNPGLAKDEPVIVWNLPEVEKKGQKPSYLMVNVGFWGEEKAQLHRFFAWKDVKVTKGAPYSISAADCYCDETHTKGSVTISAEDVKAHPEWMCDAGSMEWDLTISKEVAFNVGYGASSIFRKLNSFEMFWHAEGMKTKYSGNIKINGTEYVVFPEASYGYADKNWGGDFTSPWVWLSSNNLKSRLTGKKLENSVFDIGGGRPKAFGIAMNRKLLGELWYEGKSYEFNFSKFWTLSRTSFDCQETEDEIRWHVVQTTKDAMLDTYVVCKKKDMLNINYEAPNGTKRHNRLWNGGNGKGILKLYRVKNRKPELIDVILAKNIGCEFGEYD